MFVAHAGTCQLLIGEFRFILFTANEILNKVMIVLLMPLLHN